MGKQRRTANPVLIGAATILVIIIAIFVAYKANDGLPFQPSYKIVAELPSGDNLVHGADVRIGGTRVGVVQKITPKNHPDGSVTALVYMKLQKAAEPIPTNSTVLVRPKSALGQKYVQITKGNATTDFSSGSTMPLSRAKPAPVELDEIANIFNDETRRGQQLVLLNLGDALAGRGVDLNESIANLVPMLGNLVPVMSNLANNATNLGGFVSELSRTMGILAPVAVENGALFSNLDRTFSALAAVARPYIQDTISEGPETLDTAIRSFPVQRPFFRNTARLMAELQPGAVALRQGAPELADAVQLGAPAFKKAVPFNKQLATTFGNVQTFSEDPRVTIGLKDLNSTLVALEPTVSYLAPAQTVCNYVSLFFRNAQSTLSEGDINGTWQRFITIVPPDGPNNEGSPSSAPADGPSAANHLHVNPYPNAAAPGQSPQECEAGNEKYAAGKTVIGNPPGNQGKSTDTDTGGEKKTSTTGETK